MVGQPERFLHSDSEFQAVPATLVWQSGSRAQRRGKRTGEKKRKMEGVGMRERERQRQTETDRETDRETETDRQTEKNTFGAKERAG